MLWIDSHITQTLSRCYLISFTWNFAIVSLSLMQADGDLEDLQAVLGKKNYHHVQGSGSCSALIKLLPGNQDLYISQVTWNSYSSLLRVFKLIDTPFTVNGNKGTC